MGPHYLVPHYLDSESMQNTSAKFLNMAQKAVVLQAYGVQVLFQTHVHEEHIQNRRGVPGSRGPCGLAKGAWNTHSNFDGNLSPLLQSRRQNQRLARGGITIIIIIIIITSIIILTIIILSMIIIITIIVLFIVVVIIIIIIVVVIIINYCFCYYDYHYDYCHCCCYFSNRPQQRWNSTQLLALLTCKAKSFSLLSLQAFFRGRSQTAKLGPNSLLANTCCCRMRPPHNKAESMVGRRASPRHPL